LLSGKEGRLGKGGKELQGTKVPGTACKKSQLGTEGKKIGGKLVAEKGAIIRQDKSLTRKGKPSLGGKDFLGEGV